MTDIVVRWRYCCGPWSDTSLADDARKEIERLRKTIDIAIANTDPASELGRMLRASVTTTEAAVVP